MGRTVRGSAPATMMRAPTETGPCAECGRQIIVDHAKDSVAHEEPVCVPFERMMSAAGAGDGRAAARDPWGRVVPVRRS